MTILTRLALQRRSVTVLIIVLVLLAGLFTYANLERELFPEIEFPNILIGTSYPSGDPETVVRQITKPIEEAVDGRIAAAVETGEFDFLVKVGV